MMKLYEEFNNTIREISYEKNIQLIDLDSLVLPKNKFIYDEVHLNSEGSEFVSKIIIDFLTKNYY